MKSVALVWTLLLNSEILNIITKWSFLHNHTTLPKSKSHRFQLVWQAHFTSQNTLNAVCILLLEHLFCCLGNRLVTNTLSVTIRACTEHIIDEVHLHMQLVARITALQA